MGGISAVHMTDRGVPVASPSVMARLHAIDPLLALKPFRFGDNGIEWAATYEWPADDPRRERIQRQEIGPDQAFDIIAFIPLAVSVDEIPAYLEQGLTAMYAGNQRGYVERMLGRIRAENQKAPEQRWAKVIDDALERFETYAGKASPDVIRVPSTKIDNAQAVKAKASTKRPKKKAAEASGATA